MMVIRAQPEHADALTQITIAAKRHWNYPEHWIQTWLPLLTISPEYISENEVWIKLIEGKPAAYYSLKQDANELWLDNLWVLPEHMGKGIGRELFAHALERSRKFRLSTLKIEADPNAESFYQHMGARRVGEHDGEVDGQPRILPVMEIDLLVFEKGKSIVLQERADGSSDDSKQARDACEPNGELASRKQPPSPWSSVSQ
ncbi:MAG: GNAT family N-acetyltransferase [Chloroflexi bacterium]|nr:GNAT family N-acetyltransferase [Chloroflexota bacterium]